jgi:hypothetical protein
MATNGLLAATLPTDMVTKATRKSVWDKLSDITHKELSLGPKKRTLINPYVR